MASLGEIPKDEFEKWFYDVLKKRGDKERYSRRSTQYLLARKAWEESPEKKATDKEEPHKDYGTIVLCAVRYCFGRKTYMPSLVIGYVKEHWKDLSQGDRDLILRDVGEELVLEDRSPGWLGSKYDVQTWKDFHWWMSETERLKNVASNG